VAVMSGDAACPSSGAARSSAGDWPAWSSRRPCTKAYVRYDEPAAHVCSCAACRSAFHRALYVAGWRAGRSRFSRDGALPVPGGPVIACRGAANRRNVLDARAVRGTSCCVLSAWKRRRRLPGPAELLSGHVQQLVAAVPAQDVHSRLSWFLLRRQGDRSDPDVPSGLRPDGR